MLSSGDKSPFDRGEADSWYRRPKAPHKISGGVRLALTEPDELREYFRGYQRNEDIGDHKEYE